MYLSHMHIRMNCNLMMFHTWGQPRLCVCVCVINFAIKRYKDEYREMFLVNIASLGLVSVDSWHFQLKLFTKEVLAKLMSGLCKEKLL